MKKVKHNKLVLKVPASWQGFRGLFLLFFFLQIQFAFAVTPFHFAFITDIHLSTDTATVNSLERCVNQINHMDSIDFVLVGGDMVEKGDTFYLQKSKEILDKLKVKFYIVPGNHETILLPNKIDDFIRTFGDDKFAFQHNGITFLGFNTGPEKYGEGKVSKKDLKWLKKQLKKTGKKKPVILVTHYPLQKGDVENWDEVIKAVKPYNIRAVLNGHYHRNAVFSFDGIPGIVNRAMLRDKEKYGAYNVYEITPESLSVFEQSINDEPEKWLEIPLK